jgi:hypothetical protein
MRTALISRVLGCLVAQAALAQTISPPPIEWQRTFGGNNDDTLIALQQTTDGGFILGGYSYSYADGNKTATNFGGGDFWVVRLDANGNRLWDNSFGGSDGDILYSLQQTFDGGFVLGGSSRSSVSGNKTAGNFGFNDFWVVRLDAGGAVLWDRNFGGGASDYLRCLQQTADGGYILGGYSSSGTDGSKTAAHLGNNDFWIVRVDANGHQLWDRAFGGGGRDTLSCLQQTRDGGFILGGDSLFSLSGNKTSPIIGLTDWWIVGLDPNGNKLWEHSFGGTNDDFLTSLQQTSDGGFVLGGSSASSASGNKSSPNFGGYDFWVMRLDEQGNKLWDRSFGGSGHDFLNSLQQTSDGGFILGGYSSSGADGNKSSPNFGLEDFWVVRLDAGGNKVWDLSLGGTGSDALRCLRQSADGGFILGGRSESGTNGTKSSPNFGASDFWVVKLATELPRLRVAPQTQDDLLRNGFRFFLVSTETNHSYVIEYSTNLNTWIRLQTNRLTATEVELVDRDALNFARRFYRVVRLP